VCEVLEPEVKIDVGDEVEHEKIRDDFFRGLLPESNRLSPLAEMLDFKPKYIISFVQLSWH